MEEGGMTQGELEFIVRDIRTRCLHSSWSELVGFWESVMGNLEDAYRTVVRSTVSSHRIPSADLNDMQTIARDKLAMALRQLAGERHVARWDAETTGE
jgi:hypothetical protein